MKNILVTGGFGFIGSHLVEALLVGESNRVHVVDDLSTSPIEVQPFIRQLNDAKRLTFSFMSVRDYFGRPLDGKEVVFDEIYHLASVVGPVMLIERGGRILGDMVADTYTILDYCIQHESRLLDFSTGEVYGPMADGISRESDMKVVPAKASARLEYSLGKLACEVATTNATRMTKKLHATIVRPFNATGPRQKPWGGFVLPRFIEQALAGKPLTVYYNGQQSRSFTDVRDIAEGVILMMKHGTSGEAYNIGNPANKCSVLDLAKRVIEITGSQSEITFVDPKKIWGPLFEECADKFPDVERAIHELGWKPRRGLDEIILSSVEYERGGRND